MFLKILILVCLGLLSLPIIKYFKRKIIIIKSSIFLKLRHYSNFKKDIKRQKTLAYIDKANQESEKNDKLFLMKRKLKGLNDPNFDLFYDEEKVLHQERLKFKSKSKWNGILYFADKKGNIYYISRDGKKIYKNNF